MNNVLSKQNKMYAVNSHFATISEVEILKNQEDAVPENTKKVTKSVVEITEWEILYNLYTHIYIYIERDPDNAHPK